jgi:protein gp37
MPESKIEWTRYTFNPWTGCSKVSPACANCYAETSAKRWGKSLWGEKALREFRADPYWRQPVRWQREAEKAGRVEAVFCASQSDIFERYGVESGQRWADVNHEVVAQQALARKRLGVLIRETPNLFWLLLTKRPENWRPVFFDLDFADSTDGGNVDVPPNVGVGVTAENQKCADERIPVLLQIPAALRFLSCEPLLGPLDLSSGVLEGRRLKLGWVIAGTESGPHRRATEMSWVRELRDQCSRAGVPFFLKQLTYANGRKLPFDQWQQDLRVREWPDALRAE